MASHEVGTSPERPAVTAHLLRRGLRLEYATLGWNGLEIVFLSWAAWGARSVALAGFALDSCIEVFASLVVVKELKGEITDASERRAVRRIGVAFLLLAIYVTLQSIVTVVVGVRPESSPFGIFWLSATVMAMLGLAWAKHRTGRQLGHRVLVAEAKVTMVDGALATGVLIGLVLNATLGWWWADIAAGFIVVAYGLREGLTVLRDRPA